MKDFLVTIAAIVVGIFLFSFITGSGGPISGEDSIKGQVSRIGEESITELTDISPTP